MASRLQYVGRGQLLLRHSKKCWASQHYSVFVNSSPEKCLGEQQKSSRDILQKSQELHVSAAKQYPTVQPLPLPANVEEINAAEMACFSPQRVRDISGPVILSKTVGNFLNGCARSYNQQSYPLDLHVASYDCRGTVSLSSLMQTMVPEPFSKEGHATYLNMPGGQWAQGHKYISRDMHNTHYQNLKQKSTPKDGDPVV